MGNPSPAGRRRLLVLCTIYTSNSRSSLNIVHPLFIRDHGWKIFGNRVRGVKDAGRRERWGRGRPIQIQMLIDPAMDPSHCIYRQGCMQPTFLSNTFVSNSINLYSVNILNRFEKFLTNESRDVNTFALWDEVGWVKVRHSRHSCEKTKLLKGTRIIFNMAATKEAHNLKKLNL